MSSTDDKDEKSNERAAKSAGAEAQQLTPSTALIKQLSAHAPKQSRYRLIGEIARGGMGAILKVWDDDLNRHSAMKVVLGQSPATGETPGVAEARLARFLEEAQVTGQLNHPGIIPVHELGIDSEGRVYFTMRLLNGHDLRRVLELSRRQEKGWNQVRLLGVLIKVCEAMSYAHSKGVLHRDLKPSNIMVGRFGETYVMDWGLAKLAGHTDEKDIRPRPEPSSLSTAAGIRSDLRPGEEEGSPVVTMDGDVLGTPAYMPPEQARGELQLLDQRSDVYAIGAILYQLLTGRGPYVPASGRASPYTILRWVIEGPPQAIREIEPSADPELTSICNKAMQRDTSERYQSMQALLEDLRAYGEGRVVRAHRTGAVVELAKWVKRNRAAALAGLAAVIALVSAIFGVAWSENRRANDVQLERDMRAAQDLVDEVDSLGPTPSLTGRMKRWLAEADDLRSRQSALAKRDEELSNNSPTLGPPGAPSPELVNTRRTLPLLAQNLVDATATLENESAKTSQEELEAKDSVRILPREIGWLKQRLTRLERVHERSRQHASLDEDNGSLLDLKQLVDHYEDLFGVESLYSKVSHWRDRTASLERETVEAHAALWAQVVASVAHKEGPYGGIDLQPQVGLVPLRQNEADLWEFWHMTSGEKPVVGPNGAYEIRPGTGIVLVLVPGGSFQRDDTKYSIAIELSPYLLSKYELTQGQWLLMTGHNPSEYYSSRKASNFRRRISRTHPVERVSWETGSKVLRRYGLTFPTESQFEWACGAGLEWDLSVLNGSLASYVNLADAAYERSNYRVPGPGALDDNWELHAPVDALLPNGWGFHHILGNVSEWMNDWNCQSYGGRFLERIEPGSGELIGPYRSERTYRGGSFMNRVWTRKSRYPMSPLQFDADLGIRPACLLRSNG